MIHDLRRVCYLLLHHTLLLGTIILGEQGILLEYWVS
jgi:hypothetical protein